MVSCPSEASGSADRRSTRPDVCGIGRTGHGQLVTLRRLLTLADSEIRYTTMTITGEILHHGRAKRLATPAQRRALAARDGGCCFPNCTRPAAWTEAHHIKAWIDGGLTDLNNLCLLCAHHHRSFESAGWAVLMADGVPQWIPPAWLDPSRRPRRNTVHQLTPTG